MDGIVDLDAAAAEIERRRADWRAHGLQPDQPRGENRPATGPTRSCATATASSSPIPSESSSRPTNVARWRSFCFRGGWADLAVAVYDDDRPPILDARDIRTPEALGSALERGGE